MHRVVLKPNTVKNVRRFCHVFNTHVHEEVKWALNERKPIVALESTIITHGMPYPQNIKCALEVEETVRKQGAIPATVAIIDGKIKVGLTEGEITSLGDVKFSRPIKTSRRDFPYVISEKRNGGTTVSGTIVVANKVGISVFATGGIGGVHRDAAETFDISADLTELGRSSIAVISSGIKSILDIPKTLEYLETQGVFVAAFGKSREFPAFYSRISGCKAPYAVENAAAAARIIKSNKDFNLNSGMLFGVPCPEEFALKSEIMNNVVEEAIKKSKTLNVIGKEITPFLLSQVSKLTGSESLKTNVALIKENAKIAADISVELCNLENGRKEEEEEEVEKGKEEGKVVIVGGSNLDCNASLDIDEIKLDGRMLFGNFRHSAGGVGRNICEALCKLGCNPTFISAVGDDEQGKWLSKYIPVENRRHIKVLKDRNTAQCIVMLDKNGDCVSIIGDMNIHTEITPKIIRENEDVIKQSQLIVLDGNLPLETMEFAFGIAKKFDIPVFFEPTDIAVARKPFQTTNWNAIKFITPNVEELKQISKELNISSDSSSDLEQIVTLAKQLARKIENVLVTLGPEGVLVVRKGLATDGFNSNVTKCNEIRVRHYPGNKLENFINVSGAGDCLASGFIAALLKGLSEEICMAVGFASAMAALQSQTPVPGIIIDRYHVAWKTPEKYITL